MARIARALGTQDAPAGLYDLGKRLGLKMSLADLGMKASDLDRAADLATQAPYPNPAPIERTAVRRLLEAAHAGRRPA
jgi:maleylacetate reductase